MFHITGVRAITASENPAVLVQHFQLPPQSFHLQTGVVVVPGQRTTHTALLAISQLSPLQQHAQHSPSKGICGASAAAAAAAAASDAEPSMSDGCQSPGEEPDEVRFEFYQKLVHHTAAVNMQFGEPRETKGYKGFRVQCIFCNAQITSLVTR